MPGLVMKTNRSETCATSFFDLFSIIDFLWQRERRYEPRERQRIANLERALQRERLQKEAEDRDKIEMHSRLDVWDDDESDEQFYTER